MVESIEVHTTSRHKQRVLEKNGDVGADSTLSEPRRRTKLRLRTVKGAKNKEHFTFLIRHSPPGHQISCGVETKREWNHIQLRTK